MHGTLRQPQPATYGSEAGLVADSDEQRIDLRAILGLVRRHKWTIIVTFACVFGGAILLTSQISKRYTADALVVVDSRDAQLLGVQPGISDVIGRDAVVDTEVEIASSTTVLRRAAETLNIAAMPEFADGPSKFDMLKSMVGLGGAVEAPPTTTRDFFALPADEQARLIERLSASVDIGRRGVTNVISIAATLRSAQGSATVANAIAEAYIGEQIDAKLSANDRAAALLRDRVEALALSIAEIEGEIDAFVSAKLEELGSPEAKALLARLGEEANKRQLSGATLAEIETALSSQDFLRLAGLVETQQSGLAARRQALAQQLSASGEESLVLKTRATLEALDREIEEAAQRRASALQEEIALSNGLSVAFRRQIESTLSNLELPREVSAELARIQREADSRRALYDSSLAKLRQVEQQSDFKIPDSRVIAYATPPTNPSYPPTNLVIVSAIIFGLAAGLGLAFLREHFIGGIASVEQLESLAQIPVVAGVPRFAAKESRDEANMAIVTRPLSPFSEAIRRIQLGVDVLAPRGKRCIFVTSAIPGEGKTTVAIALARQLSMTGASTLLIDADMRQPAVHRYLKEEAGEGLIGFLSRPKGADVERLSIVREAATGVSFVLGAQASAAATDALLMSNRFDQLMEYAREKFDVVIVDTPPIGLVVDAAIVARHCALGIFVVRHASTNQHLVRNSLRDLKRTDVPICGVLNVVHGSESYRYGGAYHQYYGQASA